MIRNSISNNREGNTAMGEDAAAAAAEESKKTVYVAPSDGGAPGLVKTSL